MTDSTDDYHFAEDYSLAPLIDDCKLLGILLDDCLKADVGTELFTKVERIRAIAHCAADLALKHDPVGWQGGGGCLLPELQPQTGWIAEEQQQERSSRSAAAAEEDDKEMEQRPW